MFFVSFKKMTRNEYIYYLWSDIYSLIKLIFIMIKYISYKYTYWDSKI